MQKRQPIVVVLGHVDHGKTTLLDAVRKTSIAAREIGGITQSIGASVVNGICFIDTPGHAAFTKMRARGAKPSDIAILVIAQDDGIKPQTLEALKIIQDADIPFVIAATKADAVGANPEVLKGQLEKEGILLEGRGGQVPFVSVSAKIGQGIKELLDTILLLSEVSGVSDDPNKGLEAIVIESDKEKMGSSATVVIRNGSVKVGDTVFIEDKACKVRALFDYIGKSVKEVGSGFPAKILGFSEVPAVGTEVLRESKNAKIQDIKLKNPFDLRRLKDDEIPFIIKAGNAGALEAVIASLPEKAVVVDSGVGEVTTSDIINAKTGSARVFSFEAKIPSNTMKLAEMEKIEVKKFEIIYELIKAVEDILDADKVHELGRAKVLASFPFDNKKVAGSKALNGKISKGDKIILMRKDKEIGTSKAVSLKKQKQEVAQVIPGEEFGVILDPQLAFEVGDVLLSVAK